MRFDFDTLLDGRQSHISPQDDIALDAAWVVIERMGWVPTPQLLFALKEQIREQMLGG
jgi:hypothetical protein